MSYFVHPSSFIDTPVAIGDGTKIWYFCHILPNSAIGKNCIIGQNCMVGSNVRIGNGVKVQNNVSIYDGVELEDDVFCGPSMVFTNVINPRAFLERKHEFKKTLIKRGATLGANCTIVCGVTVGRYALVGAGTVVTSDVPDHALMLGVPAKRRGWVCRCGVTLKNLRDGAPAACPGCGSRYTADGEMLSPMER